MFGRPFGSMLDACAASFPREVALVEGDRRYTYAEMFSRIRATGRALRSLGLHPGDRVAVVMTDCCDLITVMYATLWAGLTIVPLNARLSLDDHVTIIKDCDARVLAFSAGTAARGNAILERVSLDFVISAGGQGLPANGYALEDLVEREQGGPGYPEVEPGNECWIQYTGGTTGVPKGVIHTHNSILAAQYGVAFELGIEPDERHALVAPLTHGALPFFLGVWLRGGTNIILGGFDPIQLLDTIQRERVTSTMMVPTMIYKLLDVPNLRRWDLSSLRTIGYGAAPIGKERLEQALEVFGPIFIQIYGHSEALSQTTLLAKRDHVRAAEHPQLLTSCGRAAVLSEVRVADDQLNTLPDGEIGEIVVRGQHVMRGYEKKPKETAEVLCNGWLRTGDLGRRDEDGYFYIVDRKKDMIISGGFNVYPKEVENALFQHPMVSDVCVIGVPDEKWGEAVKAVVVRLPGRKVSEQELIDHVKKLKGSVLAPKSIDFVDAIPLTMAAKHDKKALRAKYWAGRERAVN